MGISGNVDEVIKKSVERMQELEESVKNRESLIRLLRDQLKGERERAIETLSGTSEEIDIYRADLHECARVLILAKKMVEKYDEKFPNCEFDGMDYSDLKSRIYKAISKKTILEAVGDD